jgi:protein-L-isoaspartate(D-aspartate) O-methyltransferase
MAATCGEDLAYLTLRRFTDPAGVIDGRFGEFGVIGHGPAGAQLADHVAGLIRRWHATVRDRVASFELRATLNPATEPGQHVIRYRHTSLVVSWN